MMTTTGLKAWISSVQKALLSRFSGGLESVIMKIPASEQEGGGDERVIVRWRNVGSGDVAILDVRLMK
jgi:hypothetical protein